MPSYLVTISQTILVEAEDDDDARVNSLVRFDFADAEFETEELCSD
jgi:type IV secretory pathway component VirB8